MGVAGYAYSLMMLLAAEDIAFQGRQAARTVGGGGVVVQLQQLSMGLRRLHHRFKVAGYGGVVRVTDDVDIWIFQDILRFSQ